MAVVRDTPLRRRRGRPTVLLVPLAVAALAAVVVLGSDQQLSDRGGRVTISVPRTWSDETRPEAGGWVGRGENRYRVPDLEAGNVAHERTIGVVIEPRERGLVERHEAEVADFCYSRACVDRGQPTAVEVNGRRGFEQVLSHAGREWTVLLTLESDRHVVTVDGGAGEFSTGWTIERMRQIVRTVVITD